MLAKGTQKYLLCYSLKPSTKTPKKKRSFYGVKHIIKFVILIIILKAYWH